MVHMCPDRNRYLRLGFPIGVFDVRLRAIYAFSDKYQRYSRRPYENGTLFNAITSYYSTRVFIPFRININHDRPRRQLRDNRVSVRPII